MDRRAWQDTVHEVAKSQTQLSDNVGFWIDILEASPVVQLVKNLPAMQKTQKMRV